ncbi:hypothetical protein Trydic_g12618 [Trypoxylus dichotomus]
MRKLLEKSKQLAVEQYWEGRRDSDSALKCDLQVIQTYCAVGIEYTTVTDDERAQGYSCKSFNDDIGLMKDGEIRKHNPKECAEIVCNNGQISYTWCGVQSGPPECKRVIDSHQPFPKCCPKFVC